MLVPLARALTAAEVPALDRSGITMWGYVVLTRLVKGDAPTQAAMAEEIGADKSRLIPTLDDLQARGLIERIPDPSDRRRRIVALTGAGAALQARAQAEIRKHEERVLATLAPDDREAFLRVLQQLLARPRSELRGEG